MKQRLMAQTNLSSESGRSMVEMLGVLAIIGVLSIGGIAGYRAALNRYRANEIFDGINKRMIVAKTQIAAGQDDVNLSEFPDLIEGLEYEFSFRITSYGEEIYYLTIRDIPQELCGPMKSLAAVNTQYQITFGCGGDFATDFDCDRFTGDDRFMDVVSRDK